MIIFRKTYKEFLFILDKANFIDILNYVYSPFQVLFTPTLDWIRLINIWINQKDEPGTPSTKVESTPGNYSF